MAVNSMSRVLLLLALFVSYVFAATYSPDNTCGGKKGYVCGPKNRGTCCSKAGTCGATPWHCETGCNSKYGKCTPTCGPKAGNKMCPTGTCCSAAGFCGTTSAYCFFNTCNKSFGKCWGPPGCGAKGKNAVCPSGLCCNNKTGVCGSGQSYCSLSVCSTKFGRCWPAPAPVSSKPPSKPASTPTPTPSSSSTSSSTTSSSSSTSASSTPTCAPLGVEVLINGDFETGELHDGWQITGLVGTSPSSNVQSTNPHTGKYSYFLQPSGNFDSISVTYAQVVPLCPSATYNIGAFAQQASNGICTVNLRLTGQGVTPPYPEMLTWSPVSDGSWGIQQKEFYTDATTTKGTFTVSLRCNKVGLSTADSLYIDDVSLKRKA